MIKSEEEEEQLDSTPADKEQVNQLMVLTKPFNSKQYANGILAAAKAGEVDALAAMTFVKRCAKIAELVLDDEVFKKLAIDEAYKHLPGNTKSFTIYSAYICKGATSTKYDFSECNDPVLEQLYKIQEYLKGEIKKREEELKLLIPREGSLSEFAINSDSKDIAITHMPDFKWIEHQDQVTVKAPKKMQTQGIKFMKV